MLDQDKNIPDALTELNKSDSEKSYESDKFATGKFTVAADFGFTGSTGLVAEDDRLYVLDSVNGKVTTFDWDSGLTYASQAINNTSGVSGLDGLADVSQSLDGSFSYALGQDVDSLAVINPDSGIMEQRLTNNSGGLSGLTPTSASPPVTLFLSLMSTWTRTATSHCDG